MGISRSEPPDFVEPDGGYTPDEQDLMRRVARSKVWRIVRDAMALERERVLAATPTTQIEIAMSWGAVAMLQHLLQAGPRFVVHYQRDMQAREEAKAASTRSDGPPSSELAGPFDLE